MEIRIDSRKVKTRERFHDEVSSAFRFPDYYGRNIHALRDCLTDLAWLPSCEGYLVIFEHGETLLIEENHEVLNCFLSAFQDAGLDWGTEISRGEWWDRKAIPFHTVFEFGASREVDWLGKIDREEITIGQLESIG